MLPASAHRLCPDPARDLLELQHAAVRGDREAPLQQYRTHVEPATEKQPLQVRIRIWSKWGDPLQGHFSL